MPKVTGIYARDTHDRGDLVREIILRLWRSFEACDRRRARFSTWMYRVALNVAISHARGSSRSGAGRCESLDEVHPDALAWAGDGPHGSPERDERLAALHAFIQRLGPLNFEGQ